MEAADLLVVRAEHLLTMVGPDGETKGPRRGEALAHLGAIRDGAVAVREGRIAAVGTTNEILGRYVSETILDARGGVVLPGFVDGHTHPVWAGSRAWELDLKVQGKTYAEIGAMGGGILYTVGETRNADAAALTRLALGRFWEGVARGTTVFEAKTGYGLSHDAELESLQALESAGAALPARIYRTYLGLHEKPPEHADDPAPYLDEVRTKTLPEIKRQGLADFVDAFVEKGVYTADDVMPVLKEAKRLGFRLRLHADEFNDLGGARFAVEMGATSADHLLAVSDDGIEALASSKTAATLLPLVPFAIRKPVYAPARRMIDAGCIVALASDFNPNCHGIDMMNVVQHAVYGMGMRPAEALVAATVNAGFSLDPDAGHGVIAVGHPADIIITDAPTPLHLAYAFGRDHVKAVVSGGRVVRDDSATPPP